MTPEQDRCSSIPGLPMHLTTILPGCPTYLAGIEQLDQLLELVLRQRRESYCIGLEQTKAIE